jgi:hypothetical protein
VKKEKKAREDKKPVEKPIGTFRPYIVDVDADVKRSDRTPLDDANARHAAASYTLERTREKLAQTEQQLAALKMDFSIISDMLKALVKFCDMK